MRSFLLRFYTRDGCPLCDEGLEVLEQVTRRTRVEIEIVDIEDSDRLTADYGMRIPVIEDVDGNVLAEGRVERKALRKAIRRRR